MRLAAPISRSLLGALFLVFGLNGFFAFIYQPPPTNPLAAQFFGAAITSHFATFFSSGQVVGGVLLLSGLFVPLALTIPSG